MLNEFLKSSTFWPNYKVFTLNFTYFLLKIGNGSLPFLKIPENWKTDDVFQAAILPAAILLYNRVIIDSYIEIIDSYSQIIDSYSQIIDTYSCLKP